MQRGIVFEPFPVWICNCVNERVMANVCLTYFASLAYVSYAAFTHKHVLLNWLFQVLVTSKHKNLQDWIQLGWLWLILFAINFEPKVLLFWKTFFKPIWAIKWSAVNDRALKGKFCQKISVQYVKCILCDVCLKLAFVQQMYGSLMILPPSCFVYFWKTICSQKRNVQSCTFFDK